MENVHCLACNKQLVAKNGFSQKSCNTKCVRALLEARLIPAWEIWVEEGEDYEIIPGSTKELKGRNSAMIGFVRGGQSLREAAKYGGIKTERLRQIIAKFLEVMIDYS